MPDLFFRAGEKISAKKLNAAVAESRRTPNAPVGDAAPRFLRVKNSTDAAIPRFGALEITGFLRSPTTRDEAIQTIAANGVEVVGTTPTGTDGAFLVVATEPIPIGGTGAATFANGSVFVGEVTGLTAAKTFANATANATTFAAADDGAYKIVARTTSGVCLLTPKIAKPTLRTTSPGVSTYCVGTATLDKTTGNVVRWTGLATEQDLGTSNDGFPYLSTVEQTKKNAGLYLRLKVNSETGLIETNWSDEKGMFGDAASPPWSAPIYIPVGCNFGKSRLNAIKTTVNELIDVEFASTRQATLVTPPTYEIV